MHKNKFLVFFAIFTVFLLILPGTSLADETPQLTQGQANQSHVTFGLRLTGGASLLMRNDFNDHMQSYNDFYNDASFFTVGSEFELIKMGMDLSGEILVSPMPNFSIGIGAGYLSAGKESTLEISHNSYSADLTFHPSFSIIPITLSFYFGPPLGSSVAVVLNAGFGYYLGTVNYDVFHESQSGGYSYENLEAWSAKSNALGFHGGIDLEFGIARNLAFIVGAKGRYAILTDLTGDLEYEYDTSYGYSDSGTVKDLTLWFGDNQDSPTGKKYPMLALSDSKPSGTLWSNVRKAEVNLSGIVFQAGIKVFF
jgi:hypothetical protein